MTNQEIETTRCIVGKSLGIPPDDIIIIKHRKMEDAWVYFYIGDIIFGHVFFEVPNSLEMEKIRKKYEIK